MENSSELIQVGDFYKLAVLDLHRVQPVSVEVNGRYQAAYKRSEAEQLLTDYTSGKLKVVARDFGASLQRVKHEIFESLHTKRNGDINNHGKFESRSSR